MMAVLKSFYYRASFFTALIEVISFAEIEY
jgi:hypothetical protein